MAITQGSQAQTRNEDRNMSSDLVFQIARTTEYIRMRVRLTKAGERHLKRCQDDRLCLGCERQLVEGEQVRRGLCATCYPAANAAIKRDESIEKELLKTGRLLLRSKGGRPAANEFTKKLASEVA